MALLAYSPWGNIPEQIRTASALPFELPGHPGCAFSVPFPHVFPIFAGQAIGPGGYESNVAEDQLHDVQRITETGAKSYE